MRKLLVLASLLALGATVLRAAAAGEFPRGLAGRETVASEDSPSVGAFVAALKAEMEGAAVRPAPSPKSFQEAIGRIAPDYAGAPRCLTPVVLELSRQAASSPALASWAGPVFSPPVLSRELVSTSPDGAFAIHYTLDRVSGDAVLAVDRDHNGIPDYVDLVASSLASAREAISTRMGFRPPLARDTFHLYLANLGGRIDGYTASSASGDELFTVLDSRLLGNDALLRAAVTHQYAHASLAPYAPQAPPWWIEATAAWLEGVAVGSYAHYTEQIQAAVDRAASGLVSDDARLCQGHLLWPVYLATLGGREPLVRRIWENLEQQGEAADLWRATDDALRAAGSSTEAAFSDYSLWLLLSGERSDGRHFAGADRFGGVSFTGLYEAYPATQIQTAPSLAPLGVAFMRFTPDSVDGGLRLRFEGDVPGIFQAQVLLTPRKRGAALVRAPISVDSRGRGSIGIPWATFSEAILIVGNVARVGGDAPYSFVARSEPNFPFEIVSFNAEPSDEEVRVTWETRSESGLFGWIVYRSDRPSGVPHRINEFVVPAIGDGDGPVSYQYVDDGVTRGGTYFYSLKLNGRVVGSRKTVRL